jgi:phosphoglycerate dehydrogenase-like enzyme
LAQCLNMIYTLPESLRERVRERLRAHAIEVTDNSVQRWYTEDELVRGLKGIDAVLAGDEAYSLRVMESADRLKIIARVGVGYDNVDLDAATRRGILVTNTPVPELAKAVAEEAFTLILSLLRRITFLDKMMRKGIYYTSDYYSLVREAFPLTLGIIGLGRIGKQVARRAVGFEMKVQYYDVVRDDEFAGQWNIRYASLRELLETSDVITVHIPLTPETRGMIGERELGMMKGNAILINAARGALVDERALYAALREGRIGGAGISVYTQEPPRDGHPFYKVGEELDNLVLLPHVGDGPHSVGAQVDAAVGEVIAALEGKEPRYVLNALKRREGIQKQ